MKLNVFKILQLVTMGIEVAEQLKGPKRGEEKLDYVLESTDAMLPKLEAAIGKDLLRDARVRPFAVKYINAAIDLKNIIEAAKELKVADGCCGLCGKPLPPGEEMFKYHGYSGPCPT